MTQSPTLATLRQLHRILVTRFDEGELHTLCFHLGVDYDDLPAAGRANKARELVTYLEHRGRIYELVRTGEQLRPDISWSGTLETPQETSPASQGSPPPAKAAQPSHFFICYKRGVDPDQKLADYLHDFLTATLVVLIIGHVYFAVFIKKNWPDLRAMFTGKIPLEEYEKYHEIERA